MEMRLFLILNVLYLFFAAGLFYLLVRKTPEPKSPDFYIRFFSIAMSGALFEMIVSDLDPHKNGIPTAGVFTLMLAAASARKLYELSRKNR